MREPTCFGLTGEFITCTSLKNRQTDRPISLPVGTSSCSRCSVETSYSSSTYNPIRHIRCMATRCGSRENAMCESFFATLECELLARCRFQTHDQARHAIFEYLESWYNLRRRHSGLGYRSPAIFEDTYRAKTQHSPVPVASCPPPASVMVVRGDPPAGRGQLSSGI